MDDLAPDDWRRSNPRFQGDNIQRNLELVDDIQALAREKRVTAAQLALAWLLTRGEQLELHRLEVMTPVGVAAGTRYPEGMMLRLNG